MTLDNVIGLYLVTANGKLLECGETSLLGVAEEAGSGSGLSR